MRHDILFLTLALSAAYHAGCTEKLNLRSALMMTVSPAPSSKTSKTTSNSPTPTPSTSPKSPISLTSIADRTFASGNPLYVGSTLTVDVDNALTGDDTGTSYTCYYDQAIDGSVSSGTACSSLPGTSASFDTSAGVLNWTPTDIYLGSYEIKITGTKSGFSDSKIFVVDVVPDYVTANLRGNWDAQFAANQETNYPNASTNLEWMDLTSNGFNGTNSNSVHAAWTGAGTTASPHRLTYDGNGYTDFGSSPMSGQNTMMFNAWISGGSVTSLDKVIMGNSSDATGNGFTLRQSKVQSNRYEMAVGPALNNNYHSIVLADNPIGYWPLNETSGSTAYDLSTSARNGAYINSPTLGNSSQVVGGNSAHFNNALSQYVNIGSLGSTPSAGTIEFWASADSIFNFADIFSTNGPDDFDNSSMRAELSVSGAFAWVSDCCVNGSGTFFNSGMQAATWYHFVLTWNMTSGVTKSYVNGVKVNTGSISLIPANITNFTIGVGYSTIRCWLGYVSDVSVYNTDLSESQVENHYNAGIGGSPGMCVTKSTFNNSDWNLIGGIYDGSNLILTVNGQQECSIQAAGGLTSPATHLVTGATVAGTNGWTGSIADFKLYSTNDGSSPGTITDLKTNFNATADFYRVTPVGNIVTDGLVLNLDAANAERGLVFPGTGCNVQSWFDLSSSNLNGTLENFSGCGASSGWNGSNTAIDPYRLTFDGVDDVVTFNQSPISGTGSFSIETWFNTSATGLRQYFAVMGSNTFSPATCTGPFVNTSNVLEFDLCGVVGPISAITVTDGNWHMADFVYNSGTGMARVYVDDSASGSAVSLSPNLGSNLLMIGYPDTSVPNNGHFNGSLATVRVYNRALAQSEITQNCQAQVSRFSGAVCN